jgi:hypothetical protein
VFGNRDFVLPFLINFQTERISASINIYKMHFSEIRINLKSIMEKPDERQKKLGDNTIK